MRSSRRSRGSCRKTRRHGEPALADARIAGRAAARGRQPAEAQHEFELSLKSVPNRFRSLAGAGHAAALAGDKAQARRHYRQLLVLTKDADGERAALKAAREFLARR